MTDRQPTLLDAPEAGPQSPLVEVPAPEPRPNVPDRLRRGKPRVPRPRPVAQMALPGAMPEPEWQRIVRGATTPAEREAWPVVPWDARVRQWLAHAESTGFRARLERAKAVAREGATKGRMVCNLSGGKDSSALAGVLAEAGVSALGLYAMSEFDYPNTLQTVDALGRAVGMVVRVLRPAELARHVERICKAYGRAKIRKRRGCAEFDEWDLLRAIPAGECLLDPGPMAHVVKAAGHANVLTAHQYAEGFDGSYMGMRAQESLGRHINYKKQGALYRSALDGRWSCTPIAHWSGQDVWAMIVSRGLPVHEFYRLAYETGLSRPDPGRIRTGALPYADIAAKGVLVPVARVYPAWWAKLTSYRPELLRFVEGRST